MKKSKKIVFLVIIIIIFLIVVIGLNIKFNPTYNVTEEFEHCASMEGVFDIKGNCYPILVYKNINNKLFCFIKGGTWGQIKINKYSCVVPNK